MQGRLGKIVLVVLGVILMLMFILPAGIQNTASRSVAMGTIDGEDVSPDDVGRARSLYLYALRDIFVAQQGQQLPLPLALFGEYAQKLEQEPLLFYLLLRESEKTGTTLPPAQVAELLTELQVMVMVNDPSSPDGRRLAAFEELVGEQIRADTIAAAGAVLNVAQNLEQFADFARISQPVLDYFVSLQGQQVDLRTVVFDAEEYIAQVEEPSEQAVRQQFEAYRDNLAGTVTPENPFGFGYRLPDRVKLQYLAVSQESVRRKVMEEVAAQPLEEREQALYGYWHENRALFPAAATQPTTRAATRPGTQPSTVPATQPTGEALLTAAGNAQVQQFLDDQTQKVAGQPAETEWRAYVGVHDRVVERMLDQRINELETRIGRRIREVLGADYRAFDLRRTATTRPAGQGSSADAAPVRTRAGVSVEDPAYLERVAELTTTEFGVRPSVASYAAEFLAQAELSDPEDVGPIAESILMVQTPQGQPTFLPFGAYALSAESLLTGPTKEMAERAGLLLSLYEPSQPVSDLAGTDYIFRLIDAAPAAAPGSLEVAAERVRRDLRRKAAFERALADARSFAEEARRVSLEDAAGPAPLGRKIHDPAPFIPASGPSDPAAFGAPADGEDQAVARPVINELAQQVFGFVNECAGQDRPIGVLEIRPAMRAIVAELQGVEGDWTSATALATRRDQFRRGLEQDTMRLANPLADFFDEKRASARVGFEPKTPRTEEEESE